MSDNDTSRFTGTTESRKNRTAEQMSLQTSAENLQAWWWRDEAR